MLTHIRYLYITAITLIVMNNMSFQPVESEVDNNNNLILGGVTALQQQHGKCATVPSSSSSSCMNRNYYHLIVLVHGYMGSDREQEYLGEALLEQSKRLSDSRHEFVPLYSKTNMKDTSDGVVKGGQRLAAEINNWIREHVDIAGEDISKDTSTIFTLSLIGNSLGGVYSRYAISELFRLGTLSSKKIMPLVFCSTSSPHLGISKETFVRLPVWLEQYMGSAMKQTGNDLFSVNDSTIIDDMCSSPSRDGNDYLLSLGQFLKRIAVANAYSTDFLVSVNSGGILDSDSNSVHYNLQHDRDASETVIRRMRNVNNHVALQVFTPKDDNENNQDQDEEKNIRSNCVNSLDRLGWHKIFLDTRNIDAVSNLFQLPVLEIPKQKAYTSKELVKQFNRYGTLLPLAHPVNVANSKTYWYKTLTKQGQPIMDSLA